MYGMYAGKRRQRNFKRIRTIPSTASSLGAAVVELTRKGRPSLLGGLQNGQIIGQNQAPPPLPSNPSKRHRERLNGELETVASLLPYDEPTIQRLDKLSVLRLAVSFLQIKAHFQVCTQLASLQPNGRCSDHPYANLHNPMGPLPSLVDPLSRLSSIDCAEPFFAGLVQRALSAFMLILNLDGDIFYVTENVEAFIGYQQSDILHMPIFDMIHSDDREPLRAMLHQIRNQMLAAEEEGRNGGAEMGDVPPIILRFRNLVENNCGFVRAEMCGRILNVHSHQSTGLSTFVPPPQPPPAIGRPAASHPSSEGINGPCKWALVTICIPFVPPLQMDPRMDDPVLKSKHSVDFGIQSMDLRLRQILELDELNCFSSAVRSPHSLYSIIHPDDVNILAESHDFMLKNAKNNPNRIVLIYRLVSCRSQHIYYLQSSFSLSFKNTKSDHISANHRILTEVDGESLLEKRNLINFKLFAFDDITLLQSPRICQQPSCSNINIQQQHSPMMFSPHSNSKPISSNDSHQKGGGAVANNASEKKGHQKKTTTVGIIKSKEEKREIKEDKKKPCALQSTMVGPYHAAEAIPFGIQINCNSGNGPHQPNNAAAIFAAAQLQTNFLPSTSHLDQISLLPSSSINSHSIVEANPAIQIPFPMGHPSEQQNNAIICGGGGNFGWTPSGGNGPPSGGISARLKRTQVTFERYYAETVDLSPYYQQQYSTSFSNAGYPQPPNPCQSSSTALMDLTASMGGGQWSDGQQQLPSDYWTSMVAAAAAAGIDPASASAYSNAAQHFHFPSTTQQFGGGNGTAVAADLMGGLASSMLYWPTHGIDIMGMGNTTSLPPFYPAPPSTSKTTTTSTGANENDNTFQSQNHQQTSLNMVEEQNHHHQQFPATIPIVPAIDYVNHHSHSSLLNASIPKTRTSLTISYADSGQSPSSTHHQTIENSRTKGGKAMENNLHNFEQKKGLDDYKLSEKKQIQTNIVLEGESIQQRNLSQNPSVSKHLPNFFAHEISAATETVDSSTQLLHFSRHHSHHQQHQPNAIQATQAQPPTPSSASSSTSGFRFLSEVAQTLFG